MKKTIEEEINEFIEFWDIDSLTSILTDSFQLIHLYNVDESDDWVKEVVGEDDLRNVRLIRTVYLLSKMAHMYAGKLVRTKMDFPNLWLRLESSVKHDIGPIL